MNIKIIILLFSFSSVLFSQIWENISPFAPGNHLKGITRNQYDNSLWICGDDGLIAKSLDDGESWEYFLNRLGDYSKAQMIYFLSENNAICISNVTNLNTIPNKSFVYKSYDECATWELVYQGENEIYSIEFADDSVGFISGRIVLKTTDGGSSWIEQTYSAKQIQFINPNLAYAIDGSRVLSSDDQGENWEVLFQNDDYRLYAFQFTNSGMGLVSVFKDENWSPNDWSAKVLYTDNGGLEWSEYDFGNTFENSIVLINSFYSEDDEIIWGSVGLDEVVKFSNKGTSWEVLSKGNRSNSSSIVSTGNNVIVVGTDGTITKSPDQGESWYTISIGKKDFYNVQFLNRNIGYASGRLTKENNYYAFLMKTMNGGDDWVELDITFDDVQDVAKIFFLDEINGYILINNVFGSRSKILKTSDGGETWTVKYDVDISNEQLNDLQFYDTNFGVAVGNRSTIVKTNNGGDNWDWTTRTNSIPIYCANIVDQNLIYFGATGLGGAYNEGQFRLLKTENSALTYESILSNITDISRIWNVKDLTFFNDKNGWVLLGYEIQNTGILYKTNDAGFSWTRNYLTGSIYDNYTAMDFLDSSHGYVTRDGYILRSNDGGQNWKEHLIENYPYRANTIEFIDEEFGVIAGEDNMLLRIKDDLNSGIEDFSDEIVSVNNLFQNYPNPFNPITIIIYQIPNKVIPSGVEGSNVQLKVYDILGKEVATLVNKKQSPGDYQAEFDGSNLPSGVYFYRLQVYTPRRAGNFIETKKMVLLR